MSKQGFYDFAPLLSHNPLIAMAVGGRGIGKTFGAKKLAIDGYLKRGDQFMYVRRYKPEIARARGKFFDDIAYKYKDHMFRVQGNVAQIAPRSSKGKSWEDIGYFVSLSTVQSLKSVPFPRVTKIIFDEFIPERGSVQYLPNEWDIVLNLLNTVDRHMDKTQVLMLANAVSIMNPHFLANKIVPEVGKIKKYANGLIACDFPASDEYNKSIAHTRTARLFAQNEEYDSYASQNEFADNAPTMIGTKTPEAIYRWTIELSTGTYSIWRDDDENHYYAQTKRPKVEQIITTVPSGMDHDKMFVSYGDLPMQLMRSAFRHGRMSFDSPTTRNAMAEIIKR